MKTYLFLLSVLILNVSCESEGQSLEKVNIIAQGDCIIGNVEGLVMEFCIFDIEGNSRTVFNENENFIISLVLKNLSQETMVIDQNLIDANFFRVINVVDNEDFGTPYTAVWCQYSLAPRELQLEPGTSLTLNSPWVLDFEKEVFPTAPLCKSENNEFLNKGVYSTGFDTAFTIKKGERTIQLSGQSEISILLTIN